MLIGSDKVIEWVRQNNCPGWRIKSNEKGYTLLNSDKDEKVTLEESLQKLQTSLQMLSAGSYFIEAWHDGLNQNSWYKTRFTLTEGGYAMQGFQMNQPKQFDPDEMQTKINEGIEKYKATEELNRLKIENAELRAQLDSSTNRIVGRLEPYLGQILGTVFPQTANVSGIQNNNSSEEMSAEQQRLEKSLENWSNKDADFAMLIDKISQLAQSDPNTYNMAKQMLLSK
jgi:hypothetical protein